MCVFSIAEPKPRGEGCAVRLYSVYVLCMLLLTYLVNQLDRFVLGIVTKPMSQELGYGDFACMKNDSVTTGPVAVCNATDQHE